MAARKKKAAKKAVKKTAKKAVKKTAKKAVQATTRKIKPRKQPETLRIRSVAPGYSVNDLARSIHFYEHILGFVVVDRWIRDGKLMGVELRAGGTTFMIGQDDFKKGKDRAKGVGFRIYCTTVQDIDQLAKGIRSRGGVLDHEPQTQPWGTRDFGVTDPDGFKVTISSPMS
jgi:uncharacterized glyoxalase superfamily protein PhnB